MRRQRAGLNRGVNRAGRDAQDAPRRRACQRSLFGRVLFVRFHQDGVRLLRAASSCLQTFRISWLSLMGVHRRRAKHKPARNAWKADSPVFLAFLSWYPHPELNRDQRFRKPPLYPFELWGQTIGFIGVCPYFSWLIVGNFSNIFPTRFTGL